MGYGKEFEQKVTKDRKGFEVDLQKDAKDRKRYWQTC